MSDDEDFMQDSDQEDYDFEYEDDDEDQGGDVDIENKYYAAKQMKGDNPEEAIKEFLGVPLLEPEKGDWGFKGLKQAIKLEFKMAKYEKVFTPSRDFDGSNRQKLIRPQAIEHYQELLTYVKSAVTRNYSEKSINNMLDFIEKTAEDEAANRCMEEFYSKTLESFQSTNNDRLWLKTNIKLARLWLDQKNYGPLTGKLRELHKSCQLPDGSDDPSKGTLSLEIYALEIMMYEETRNSKRMKILYQRALKVRSAVPHPRILGIIRQCGGKMHLGEENWKAAQGDFFESFKNFDEAGSLQRIQVLNYLVLTTMLMGSAINPFDSPETKAYQSDPRILAMTDLVDAYQRNDMQKYERVLTSNPDIVSDPFIANNLDTVTRSMRTKSVLKLVAPYTRFSLQFIAKTLKISLSEVQDIVGFLILNNSLKAKINQTQGIVEKDIGADPDRMHAVNSWTSAMDSLWSTILNSGEGFRSDDSGSGLSGGSSILGPSDLPSFNISSKGVPTGDGRKGKGQRKIYSGE